MKRLIFGTGRILVERGVSDDGSRFIFLNDTGIDRPVGESNGVHPDAVTPTELESHDVVLEFRSIESARVLQDKLNLMVSKWIEGGDK